MKYLKRYNEELEPATYRRASTKLLAKAKKKRAGEMWDYADEKEFGVYNMNFIDTDYHELKDVKVSSPKVEFYYGSSDYKIKTAVEGLTYAEQLVNRWKEYDKEKSDCKLSVTFVFSFIPQYESKNRRISYEPPTYGLPKHMTAFEIQLDLCDPDDVRWFMADKEDNDDIDIFEMYSDCNQKYIYLKEPFYQSKGVFADRKSALKFKKELPTLIKPYMKDIIDILSIVGAESEDIDEVYELINKVRINNLYDDEWNGNKHDANWFRRDLELTQ